MSSAKADVEMKDSSKEEVKQAPAKEEPLDPFFGMYLLKLIIVVEFKKTMVLMEKAAKEKDFKQTATLTK